MHPRMTIPALTIPDALTAMQSVSQTIKISAEKNKIPPGLLTLLYLRASQINNCGHCVDMHGKEARKAGESEERVMSVAAWRDTPYFTDAERAALALAESATRLSDRPDAVPDEIWNEAARHFEEPALATLLLGIATINFWNRLTVPTRQIAGSYRK